MYYMVNCCVCGIFLRGVSYGYDSDPDDDEPEGYDEEKLSASQLEWTQKGCLTINEESFKNLDLVEPCRLPSFTTIEGESVTLRWSSPGKSDGDGPFPGITSDDFYLPFHKKCLTLIEHVVFRRTFLQSDGPISGLSAIKYFYQLVDRLRPLLRQYPVSAWKGIEWEHGYYGARQFWTDNDWSMQRGWEYICADPFDIPTLTEYLISNLRQVPVERMSRKMYVADKRTSVQGVSRVRIDSLPIELLDKITSHLPISSILSLHRANQALFDLTPLHQTFWRNQISSGKLCIFLWGVDAAACIKKDTAVSDNTCWDWKTLARILREEQFVEAALKPLLTQPVHEPEWGSHYAPFWINCSKNAASKLSGDPPLGLINRVRLVKIIEYAMELGLRTE